MKNNKAVLVIGYVGIGKTTLRAAEIVAMHNLPKDIVVVDLNELSPEEARKKIDEVYPEEKQKPFRFEIKPYEPIANCFIEKPKKPRYNPKTGKTKYF